MEGFSLQINAFCVWCVDVARDRNWRVICQISLGYKNVVNM